MPLHYIAAHLVTAAAFSPVMMFCTLEIIVLLLGYGMFLDASEILGLSDVYVCSVHLL